MRPGTNGGSGVGGVRYGPLPFSQFPAAQLPASPQTLDSIGNVGNGRASQFQTEHNAGSIIFTPAFELALWPSVNQYS